MDGYSYTTAGSGHVESSVVMTRLLDPSAAFLSTTCNIQVARLHIHIFRNDSATSMRKESMATVSTALIG